MFRAHPDHAALQVHGRGATTPAALHVPAVRGGAPELPRGAAGAPGAQADAAPRPAQVPVRSLSRDAGEPRPLLRAQGYPPHPNFPLQEPSTRRTSCLLRPLPFPACPPAPVPPPSLIPSSESRLVFPQTPKWPPRSSAHRASPIPSPTPGASFSRKPSLTTLPATTDRYFF